jgi:hypothetical protein
MIDTSKLPTHIAQVVRRLNVTGSNDSADTWLMTSYISECLIKTIAIVLIAGIRRTNPSIAKRFEYELVRADGLGTWDKLIGDCTGQSYAGYLDNDLQNLVTWITQKHSRSADDWARKASEHCSAILKLLGMPETDIPQRLTVKFLIGQIIRIRNKTKAHGAVGPDFFAQANQLFIDSVITLLFESPIVQWEWFHLSMRASKENVRAIRLVGNNPNHVLAAESIKLNYNIDGLHFRSHTRGYLFNCGDLFRSNRECSIFMVPNGGYTNTGNAEFLDYANGQIAHVELLEYLQPPAPLPPSATEGANLLDIYSNVFGNLPQRPDGYVSRKNLEDELLTRLSDRNHPVITLHGRGGIGKTSLALHVTHYLSEYPTPLYEYILWLSARDLELEPSGSKNVRRAVANLETISKLIAKLLDIEASVENLALLLQNPKLINAKSILFIFDNFETLDNPLEVHRFLDTHTHTPNKVLITSRERAFKGDYPIEVEGMAYNEAVQLLKQESRLLGINSIIDNNYIDEIYEFTGGHPYVMRVLLGESAKERCKIPIKSFVPQQSDLLNVVFERSFNKLSIEGKRTFLCVSNWRSIVPELALLVVLGLRELGAEMGIEECIRLSLLSRHNLADGNFGYSAPELARHFGKKKLVGDPDRLLIQEDLKLLQSFGVIPLQDNPEINIKSLVQRLFDHSIQQAISNVSKNNNQINALLTKVAELYPSAWSGVAKFREVIEDNPANIEEAWRHAVEESPYDKDAWLARAEYAKTQGNQATRIASLISAVDADSDNIILIRDVALELCKYVNGHKDEIPVARRGVYIASLRSQMERVANQLDATGLSRLAWLFLLEDNKDGARKYANMGCEKDPTNSHCLKILERLDNTI